MKNRQKEMQTQKKLRRELEVLRAQVKSLGAKQEPEVLQPKKQINTISHELPVKKIRKDLIKTAIFTLLAISVLVGLGYFRLQEQAINLFRLQ